MKQIFIDVYWRRSYSCLMQLVDDILDHPQRRCIETRLKVIEFFERHGAATAREAFGKSRSTIYLWKHRLKAAGGKLSALAPGDRTPHRKRKRVVDPLVASFIIRYRTDHVGADKTTIAPILRAVCEKAGIKPPSESTVGRIIHDLKQHGRLPTRTRLLINARTGKLYAWERPKGVKKTRRHNFKPSSPGDLVEIDTVEILAEGLRRYILTAIDLSSRFAFAYAYKSSSSSSARDFLGKLKTVAPFQIARVQTDNGHEFLKYFAQACQDEHLVHFFNYPRHPQSNAHLERFNRTIQEQFVSWNSDLLDEPADFNRELMRYLFWYNTEKPHRAIGKVPPLRYYVDKFVAPQQSNMSWTPTTPSPLATAVVESGHVRRTAFRHFPCILEPAFFSA